MKDAIRKERNEKKKNFIKRQVTEKKGRGSIMKIKICEPDRRLKLEFSKDCSVVESDFFAGAGAG